MRPASDVFWKGCVAISPGIGVFTGTSGDNAPHRHWAHQLTIGLEGSVEVKNNTRTVQSQGVFIPANCAHQLLKARILSLYIDPTDVLASHFLADVVTHTEVVPLPTNLLRAVTNIFSTSCGLNQQLVLLRQHFLGSATPEIDPRFIKVMGYLHLHLLEPERVSRTNLARLIAMSDGRFSHWFEECAGTPLRSYKKWLRLVAGIQYVLHGAGYTTAAHSASFSDHAHFTRTFVEAFGIRPSTALNQINSKFE